MYSQRQVVGSRGQICSHTQKDRTSFGYLATTWPCCLRRGGRRGACLIVGCVVSYQVPPWYQVSRYQVPSDEDMRSSLGDQRRRLMGGEAAGRGWSSLPPLIFSTALSVFVVLVLVLWYWSLAVVFDTDICVSCTSDLTLVLVLMLSMLELSMLLPTNARWAFFMFRLIPRILSSASLSAKSAKQHIVCTVSGLGVILAAYKGWLAWPVWHPGKHNYDDEDFGFGAAFKCWRRKILKECHFV